VIVSSHHERSLLQESGWAAPDPAIIPLALTPPTDLPAQPSPTDREVGVFGFLYPGKGHAEVLEATALLPPDVGVVAIGAPSPGHEDLVDELQQRAEAFGRRFRVTGFVDDSALDATLRAVAVPVAHHRHLSASGSIPTWIAAGRRPLAPHGRYIDEFTDRSPGVVATYADSDLADALRAALDDPARTWLGDVDVNPSWEDVVAMHREVFARWAA
jgi:glycosyltransferase involved in cell wall biosynthesis